ncbi:type II toxin-antitoxin system PemK/MazF family toxin [Salibacterium halotolerans]|uniref:mRNA interferase MazF n=1 Tax=Salibacterium halotolerans TaxID=1884432 RepID=A0A1I5S5U0_9BACI|nr:type II toxin-antitoxin system PemK/MazF family toxin [Salibacterium halotolerans]SFP66138.1 mRNA interferase MazF [Salibacterium halotolerans]
MKAEHKEDKRRRLREWHPEKERLALQWIDHFAEQMDRRFVQGALHVCDLGENIGNELNKERPALIISNNRINATSGTVQVLPLTGQVKTVTKKNKHGRDVETPEIRTHYVLYQNDYPFLDKTSAVKAENIRSVSKNRLGRHLGDIGEKDLQRIKSRMKWMFDM